ncbi:MAG: hypothetical protein Q7J06_05420 [Bacteroidales bacterium]|nr:hypothetical protein [Bacteroidales bacterium]
MKKFIILFILISKTISANCDVIFFPQQYAAFCYSTEFIYNFEKAKNSKNTIDFWGGVGCVGSFFYFNQPAYGFEIAIEKRHYFQPDNYKNFFISAYLGSAYMTDFKNANYIGVIPGVKINYKAQISPKTILEPYISLSIPVMYDIKGSQGFFPIPVLTLGARFGLFKMKNETAPSSRAR